MEINVIGATAPKLDLFCHFSLVFYYTFVSYKGSKNK